MELHGRHTITTDEKIITDDNVVSVLDNAYIKHVVNREEEKYLYDYYRGRQAIRLKVKATRPEINHIVVENRCLAIVDFKTGYICGDPIIYTSRSQEKVKNDNIQKLNGMMLYENKEALDKDLFDWLHITGHGYRMILPGTDNPFEITVLEPFNTFVVYDNTHKKNPIMNVYYVTDENGERTYSVYTKDAFYVIKDSKIVSKEDNYMGLPIIEYKLNSAMMGAFESVISLLDAINFLDSDRLDGVTSFVNSLCVLYNAELPEGEDGNTIRAKGLITLKSVGENKADIKIMAEQLDQTSTQNLKDDLYNSVLQIVGMPNQSSDADSSNNGAMFLKQGYQLAETRAKDTELMFKKAEREALKLVLRCLSYQKDPNERMDIPLFDIDITFTRRAYTDIVSKSTVLATMLGNEKVAPIDAWTLSGITPDPDEACRRGLEWYEKNADADRRTEQSGNENKVSIEKGTE